MTGATPAGAVRDSPREAHRHAVRVAAAPCFEWIGFTRAPAALGENAGRPGCVNRPAGAGEVLHYAPDRWLIGTPDAATLAQLERAAQSGEGVLTEVSGKWLRIRIPGAAQEGPGDWPLAAGFAREHLLGDRGCAALWLFDCPAIASLAGPDLDLWLEASYEASFIAMLESLGFAFA